MAKQVEETKKNEPSLAEKRSNVCSYFENKKNNLIAQLNSLQQQLEECEAVIQVTKQEEDASDSNK